MTLLNRRVRQGTILGDILLQLRVNELVFRQSGVDTAQPVAAVAEEMLRKAGSDVICANLFSRALQPSHAMRTHQT